MELFAAGRGLSWKWIFVGACLAAGCQMGARGGGTSDPAGDPGASGAGYTPQFSDVDAAVAPAPGDDVDAAIAPPPDPQASAQKPPPPISGGTLLVMKDGNTAVAADPDRDRVFIVDLAKKGVREVALAKGDEPGRVVEGANGQVYVALRSGGAVVTIDTQAATVVQRRSVCTLPRGLAYDAGADNLHVACMEGALVTYHASGANPIRTIQLDRDLRDVVIVGNQLFVSRFRTAEVIVLDGAGNVVERKTPPRFAHLAVHTGNNFDPDVAWRMLPMPSGNGALLLHQRGMSDSLGAYPQGYYAARPGPCSSSIVHTTATPMFPQQQPQLSSVLQGAVLPVDGAISPNGQQLAVIAAGNVAPARQLYLTNLSEFQNGQGCVQNVQPTNQPTGEPTAVAYAPSDIVVQTREPAALFLSNAKTTIPLTAVSREDVGHAIFHHDAGGNIACASCHPEGGEDGRVWVLNVGARRSQSLRGGILATSPFHWGGDEMDFPQLVQDVFVVRMLGPQLDASQTQHLAQWVDSIPALPSVPAADPAAVQRGQTLFNSPAVGCASCHSGKYMTNRSLQNVGTGGAFKVPRLVNLSWHPPYLHAGCAPTLRDRFGGCGGGDQHGTISKLSQSQIDDLVAYLQTL